MFDLSKKPDEGKIKAGTEASFASDVIEASRQAPVFAYFSAVWCGPCKTFGPELEKTVQDAGKGISLVKFDVDNCQRIAAQMGIQSIPAVFVFVDGKPVDGFMGARTGSELKDFVSRFASSGAGESVDAEVEEAENLLTSGAAVEAAQRFAAILSEFPENAASFGGMARAYLALGNIDSAEAVLDSVPDAIVEARAVVAAKAAVELAKQASNAGSVPDLRRKVEQNPNDHQSRFELATALRANGQDEAAIDELLELFRRDREWQEGAAQAQLMRIFESLKPGDPVALKGRRRLSSLIFA